MKRSDRMKAMEVEISERVRPAKKRTAHAKDTALYRKDFKFAREKFTRDLEGARSLILWLANHYDVGNRMLKPGVLRVVDEFLAETGDDFKAECARMRLERTQAE